MLQPLDGPAKQFSITVDTVTVQELKSGATPLEERKVVTVQAEGKVYIYFGDESGTPSAATVAADGFIHFKNGKESYEASDTQKLYALAVAGSVKIRAADRA